MDSMGGYTSILNSSIFRRMLLTSSHRSHESKMNVHVRKPRFTSTVRSSYVLRNADKTLITAPMFLEKYRQSISGAPFSFCSTHDKAMCHKVTKYKTIISPIFPISFVASKNRDLDISEISHHGCRDTSTYPLEGQKQTDSFDVSRNVQMLASGAWMWIDELPTGDHGGTAGGRERAQKTLEAALQRG